jgi:oligopeptide transport system ATP-binding protein
MGRDYILEVKDLKKYFPIKRGLFYKTVGYVRAVDGVSFSLEEGKTLGIVGESGSGKTTLARLIVKLIEPNQGQIFLKGNEITYFSETEFRSSRKFAQIVFQDPYSSLDPRFTVERIVTEGMELLSREHKGVKGRRQRSKELLAMVGLSEDALERFPHEFSGGQRQRISIARALAVQPQLLILDEPVSSLDLSIQAQVISLLLELQQKLNLTYIFIAHDLRVIRHVSDEICVMYQGKILEKASSDEIFKNPLHPYTRLLFSSIPLLGKKRQVPKEVEAKVEVKTEENLCRFLPRCPEKGKTCEEMEPKLQEILPGHFVSCLRITNYE